MSFEQLVASAKAMSLKNRIRILAKLIFIDVPQTKNKTSVFWRILLVAWAKGVSRVTTVPVKSMLFTENSLFFISYHYFPAMGNVSWIDRTGAW